MRDFAAKLADLMAGKGLSQSALSRDSGVPQTTISAYLKRVNRPSWDHVQALARALGVTCLEMQDDQGPADVPTADPGSIDINSRLRGKLK